MIFTVENKVAVVLSGTITIKMSSVSLLNIHHRGSNLPMLFFRRVNNDSSISAVRFWLKEAAYYSKYI